MGPGCVSANSVQIEGSESTMLINMSEMRADMDMDTAYVFTADGLDYIIRRCPEQLRDDRELIHV